ncbi:MAG: TraG/VirB4 family ATPase [Anaerolineaceae bacterium]
MLEPYSKGVYSSYFNSQTTFDIRDEHLVVFGFENVNAHENSDRLRVYLWQVMGLIWGEILRRHRADPLTANHVMMDEVWALLSAPGGAVAIENMARRFRKRRASLWMATQQVGEFLDSKDGQRILSIVGNTFLMEQRPVEARKIQSCLELSEGVTSALTRLGTGHGVLLMPQGSVRVYVAVPDAWRVI